MAGPSSLGSPSNFILGCDPLHSSERRERGVTPYSEIIVRDEPPLVIRKGGHTPKMNLGGKLRLLGPAI